MSELLELNQLLNENNNLFHLGRYNLSLSSPPLEFLLNAQLKGVIFKILPKITGFFSFSNLPPPLNKIRLKRETQARVVMVSVVIWQETLKLCPFPYFYMGDAW